MRRIVHFRCKNCNHIFNPTTRRKRYRCSNCGKRGSVGKTSQDNFQRYTTKDIKAILDLFDQEPYDLETLKIAEIVKKRRPKQPEGAPGCWGTYDGLIHCTRDCPQIHGEEVSKSCKERKEWVSKWWQKS